MEEEVGKLAGVVDIESTATLARGTVRILYRPDTDMRFAVLEVQSRLAQLTAALPEQARPLVERFAEIMNGLGIPTQTGEFGAHMRLEIHNDGPVTILLDG